MQSMKSIFKNVPDQPDTFAKLVGVAVLLAGSLLAGTSKDHSASALAPNNADRSKPVMPTRSDGTLLLVDRAGHRELAGNILARAESETFESLRDDRDFGARLIDLRIAIDNDSRRIEQLHGSSDPRLLNFQEAALAVQDFQYDLGHPSPENPEVVKVEFVWKVRKSYVEWLASVPKGMK